MGIEWGVPDPKGQSPIAISNAREKKQVWFILYLN